MTREKLEIENAAKEQERRKTLEEVLDPNFILEGFPVIGVPLTATYKGAIVEKAKYQWYRKSETAGSYDAIQDANQPTYKLTIKDFKHIIKCTMMRFGEASLVTLTQIPISVVDGFGVVLKINIMDGRDLERKDFFTRKSDPYCVVTMGKQRYRSKAKRHTLTPEWNEHCEFRTMFPAAEKIKLDVFSWERLTDKRAMGSALVNLSDLKIGEITKRTVKLDLLVSKSLT